MGQLLNMWATQMSHGPDVGTNRTLVEKVLFGSNRIYPERIVVLKIYTCHSDTGTCLFGTPVSC